MLDFALILRFRSIINEVEANFVDFLNVRIYLNFNLMKTVTSQFSLKSQYLPTVSCLKPPNQLIKKRAQNH